MSMLHLTHGSNETMDEYFRNGYNKEPWTRHLRGRTLHPFYEQSELLKIRLGIISRMVVGDNH